MISICEEVILLLPCIRVRPGTGQIGAGIKNPNHALDRMGDGDFHEFMKTYMEKTCPADRWDAFEHELNKYRDLSKALKLCGYYSDKLDAKIQEVTQGNKDLKQLAEEAKKRFNGISTKERVEFSFQRWLTGIDAKAGSKSD